MKVKQLGNGGGLAVDQTNSAFLIELKPNDYMLVDCGFNIMSKLIELDQNQDDKFKLENLNYVYITHTHEDHVGNLSTLIYHRYFMLGELVTKIIAQDNVYAELVPILSKCKTELKSGKVVEAIMFERTSATDLSYIYNTVFKYITAYHPGTNCYGLFIGNDDGRALYISGDTKAYEQIELSLRHLTNNSLGSILMYHDFSNWNAPSRNVHACQSDIESEYSTEFASQLSHYHDGNLFDDSWSK